MSSYTLSPRAQRDMQAIWDYTEDRWGTAQAARYTSEIQTAMETIALNPNRGMACGHIRTGYYAYPVGSHILFYRLLAAGIDVVRILHQRMDFTSHL